MHFTLDGRCVSVYNLRTKDKNSICPRHLLYHLGTDFAHDLSVPDAGEIFGKYVFEALLLIAHGADDVLVQNVGYKVCFQPARVDYLFVVLAYVLQHIFNAVADFVDVVYRRKVAPPEPFVEEAVLDTLFPPVPLGAVIFVFLQFARHLSFGYVDERVKV